MLQLSVASSDEDYAVAVVASVSGHLYPSLGFGFPARMASRLVSFYIGSKSPVSENQKRIHISHITDKLAQMLPAVKKEN